MRYTYKGNQYQIELKSTGKIICEALGVEADTAEAVQAAIRKQVDQEKSVKPVQVLTFGDGYRREQFEYFEGKVKPINVGGSHYVQVWLSWKEGRRANRAKVSLSSFYLDTPANRKIMDTVVDLNKQMKALEVERDRLIETLEQMKIGDNE